MDTTREVAIPLADPRLLGEFITGLLGQRRSIERRFPDRQFEIDFDWLRNIDDIIAQRVAAQNEGKCVSFSARIFFANGKIVTLEDHNAFRTFQDLSAELSVGVDLRWTYLILFPQNRLPDKQELRFQAFTDTDVLDKKPEREPRRLFVADRGRERLSYSIQFTDVTWGEDLSSHMGNYIISKTTAVSRWKEYLRGLRANALFLIGAMTAVLLSVTVYMGQILDKLGLTKVDVSKLHTLDEKVDFLVASTAASQAALTAPGLLIVPLLKLLLWTAAVIGLFFVLQIRKASFLSLNDHSKRYFEKYNKNYEFLKYGVLAASLVSIFSGVFANRIYDVLKGLL